jgi:hypothetical protein
MFLSGCLGTQRLQPFAKQDKALLYEVSIIINNQLIAKPKLVVAHGQSGTLEVPKTRLNNGYSILIQEDGNLLTKVTLVEKGAVIAQPEILLAPNSDGLVELASADRRIIIAVRNTTQGASLTSQEL